MGRSRRGPQREPILLVMGRSRRGGVQPAATSWKILSRLGNNIWALTSRVKAPSQEPAAAGSQKLRHQKSPIKLRFVALFHWMPTSPFPPQQTIQNQKSKI